MTNAFKKENGFESEEVFRRVFECSSDAILLIDPHDPNVEWAIVLCNEAALRLHGYDSTGDLLNKPANLLYTDEQDFAVLLEEIHRQGIVKREVNHRRRDGTIFPAHSTHTLILAKGAEFLMSVERDTSDIRLLEENYKKAKEAQERFEAIFDNSPDGIVIIDPTKGLESWPIEDCNKSFAEMNGYEQCSELIGKDINVVNDKPESRALYYDRLKKGRIMLDVPHKCRDGKIITVQASSCLATIAGEERILGMDRDITQEEKLRRNMQDLQKDVGRTFHTFTSTLLRVQLALTPAIKALGPDPFEKELSPAADQTWRVLDTQRNSVVSTLRRLLESIESDFQREALSTEDWGRLEELLSALSQVDKRVLPEQRGPVLRLAARQVIDIIQKMRKGGIGEELSRQVRYSAEQLERMTCLVSLRRAQDFVAETDYLVRDLRERVITGVRQDEGHGSYEFWDLVQEAIENLSDYAAYRGLEIRKDNRSHGARVLVVRRDVIRAMNSLIHNAIKYSWWRDQKTQPWIDIRTYIKDDQAYVEIEDYGVPIPKDEIEKDLIFQLGYRGRLAGQRGRIGTGIGLSDARDTARHYGGDVTLASRPAPHDVSQDDLSVPHIKTATLYLPIFEQEQKR